MKVPDALHWLFWETDPCTLDAKEHADYILARILEFGGLAEVHWMMDSYGLDRIHRFFKYVGHPELSERTIRFWRAFFKEDNGPWASPPAFRQNSSVPWIS